MSGRACLATYAQEADQYDYELAENWFRVAALTPNFNLLMGL